MEQTFFTSTDHRILYNFGVLELPFELSLIGVLVAFFGYNSVAKWMLQPKETDKKKNKDIEEPVWWMQLLIFAGLLAVLQFVFSIIPGPKFSEIGPIALRPYSLLFAGGFVASYFISKRFFFDAQKPVEWLDTIILYFAVGTVAGARLGHCLFYDPGYYLLNPIKILAVWEGRLARHGALIGILLAIWMYDRKYPGLGYLWILDKATIPIALAGAMIRTGNFFNSEIIGHPTDLPWSVIFASIDPLPRHPSMLYEAVWCLGLMAICWQIYKRHNAKPPEGLLLGVWLIVLFTGRFLIEFTKVEQAEFDAGLLNMGQWLSVPAVLAGFALVFRARKLKK